MAQARRVQRVAAYAVIIRDDQILLSRLSERLTRHELWTLPGGGLEHGEDPRDAVVREVYEETGLDALVGEEARVYSRHQADAWRQGRRADAHALMIVYDGWVPPDSPQPRVTEVDGSTAEAAWQPLSDVLDGTVPVGALVHQALSEHHAFSKQRVAAYALAVREDPEPAVLLTRFSTLGPFPGSWSLPGGGIEHGEQPRKALEREVHEETGLSCRVGEVLDVGDVHFEGTAPSGRLEDFHAVQLVFDATVPTDPEPRPVEVDGTSDAAAWVPLSRLEDPEFPVRDLVGLALAAHGRRIVPG